MWICEHHWSAQVKQMRVDIETCSTLTAGQTVCDIWSQSPLPKNACVALVSSSFFNASPSSSCKTLGRQSGASSVVSSSSGWNLDGSRWIVAKVSAEADFHGCVQTVDVDKFWDSMVAAILKADMLSPLNISAGVNSN